MKDYSFIDFGKRDFLRNKDGSVVIIAFSNFYEANEWLIRHGEEYGWKNTAIDFWCWDDEE